MKYRRKWPCDVCGKPVIYDTERKTMSCGCRTIAIPEEIVNLQNFIKIKEAIA